MYHSFGTFVLINYLKYYNSSRVIGLIDLGGAPIRYYPFAKTFTKTYSHLPWETIVSNIQSITEKFNSSVKSFNPDYVLTPQQHLGAIKVVTHPNFGFSTMFEDHRNFPPILKCIIYSLKRAFKELEGK